jgi:hypothetical protein
MALLTAEVTWLRWLLTDFGVSVTTPTPVLSDNTCAISIARDSVKHELTKHIGVDAFIHVLRCRLRLLRFSMCLPSYSWQTSLQRHRLERSMISYSPNSVLCIHHEFEGGGVRCIYLYIVVFLYVRRFLAYLHLYLYYILWPLAPREYNLSIPNNSVLRK